MRTLRTLSFRLPNERDKIPDNPQFDLNLWELPADPQAGAQLAADLNAASRASAQTVPIVLQEPFAEEPDQRPAPGRFRSRTMSIRSSDSYSAMLQARNAARRRVASGVVPQPDPESDTETEPEPGMQGRLQHRRISFLQPRMPRVQPDRQGALEKQLNQIPKVDQVEPMSQPQQEPEANSDEVEEQVHAPQTHSINPRSLQPSRPSPLLSNAQPLFHQNHQTLNQQKTSPQPQPVSPYIQHQEQPIIQVNYYLPHKQLPTPDVKRAMTEPLPRPHLPRIQHHIQLTPPKPILPLSQPLFEVELGEHHPKFVWQPGMEFRLCSNGTTSPTGSRVLYMDPKPDKCPPSSTTFVIKMCSPSVLPRLITIVTDVQTPQSHPANNPSSVTLPVNFSNPKPVVPEPLKPISDDVNIPIDAPSDVSNAVVTHSQISEPNHSIPDAQPSTSVLPNSPKTISLSMLPNAHPLPSTSQKLPYIPCKPPNTIPIFLDAEPSILKSRNPTEPTHTVPDAQTLPSQLPATSSSVTLPLPETSNPMSIDVHTLSSVHSTTANITPIPFNTETSNLDMSLSKPVSVPQRVPSISPPPVAPAYTYRSIPIEVLLGPVGDLPAPNSVTSYDVISSFLAKSLEEMDEGEIWRALQVINNNIDYSSRL